MSKMLALTIGSHSTSHCKAGIVNDSKGTQGWCYLNPPHLTQIGDSQVIGVLCQLPHQYHCNLIGQRAPNVPIMADVAGNLGAT